MKHPVTTRNRAAILVVTLLIAAGVVACGGSSGGSSNGIASKSADAIATATASAAESAKSAAVSGSISQSGTNVGLDLKMVAGVGATGWISEQGKRLNLVLDHSALYINAGAAFWRAFANPSAASLLQGKWLKTPATGTYASLAKLGTLSDFFHQVFGHHGTLAKTAQKSINGIKAIGLRDTKQGGVLYVATSGKPYPVELNGNTGSGGGKLSFSGVGSAFKITPPKHSISLAQLQKAA
jgi:hypothetical protein